MKRNWLVFALVASVLINLGVAAGVGYRLADRAGDGQRQLFGMPHGNLPDYLGLTAEQRTQWETLEQGFVAELDRDFAEVSARRERLIRLVLADAPDAAAIEAERAAIFVAQERQQRRVIAQLLQERALLTAAQREKLAELLIRQSATVDAPARGRHR